MTRTHMAKTDNNPLIDLLNASSSDSNVTIQQMVSTKYHLWLHDEITELADYQRWFDICAKAESYDNIVVHINSSGGLLDTSIQLFNALQETKAELQIDIDGACCSGASIVAMSAIGKGTITVNDASYMMIHTATGGYFGKFSDLKKSIPFEQQYFERIVKYIYTPFLSDSEINDVLAGHDIWLTADDISDKIESANKLIAKDVTSTINTMASAKKKAISIINKSRNISAEEKKLLLEQMG